MTITSALARLIPVREASAHCDIPCGIYDPVSAKIAAQTVQKMVLRIEALELSSDASSANTFARYITVKEEHAELCKHELRVLWADYTWPGTDANDIASKFNAALKLASQCKQTVSMDSAEALVAAVDDIASVFWSTKGVEYSDPNAAVRYGV
ncbi:MAG: superoxide dismutase, Ni [Dehalococcoidia bacterium]|nr:superoxide dismutase, Ni [Dehalococcoidia bacterium]